MDPGLCTIRQTPTLESLWPWNQRPQILALGYHSQDTLGCSISHQRVDTSTKTTIAHSLRCEDSAHPPAGLHQPQDHQANTNLGTVGSSSRCPGIWLPHHQAKTTFRTLQIYSSHHKDWLDSVTSQHQLWDALGPFGAWLHPPASWHQLQDTLNP